MNKFKERYKKLSNLELFQILENKTDYQAEAVFAAEKEIEARNINKKELIEIQNKLKEQQEIIHSKEKQKKAVLLKIKKSLHFIDPTVKKNTSQIIKLTVIIIVLAFIYTIITDFSLYSYTFKTLFTGDPSFLFLFIPLCFYAAVLYFLWKGKKAGWIIFLIALFFIVISNFINMSQELSRGDYPDMFAGLFPDKGMVFYIKNIIIYTAIIVFYLSKNVRNHFNRKNQT